MADLIIAYAVHDAYAAPTAVSAASVIEASAQSVHFYMLDLGLSPASRAGISKLLGSDRVSFLKTTREGSELLNLALSDRPYAQRLGVEMYAKVLLPELLAKHDRFLYLDCDTIAVADLSPLHNVALKDQILGAAVCLTEPTVGSRDGLPDYQELGLRSEDPQFDSGMLVIDVQAYLKEDIGRKAIAYAKKHSMLPLGDLNALNAAVRGRWVDVGNQWNFQVMPSIRANHYGPLPRVYHFSGRHKPFLKGSRFVDMQILYDEYRRVMELNGGPVFPTYFASTNKSN